MAAFVTNIYEDIATIDSYLIVHNSRIFTLCMISILWAISKTLGSRNGHPQVWIGPIAHHTSAQKWYTANLRGIACRKMNDLLDCGAEAVLPIWSGIFAAGLSAIWGATGRGACKSLFPHHQHGQPACWPATSTQPLYSELSSSPGVRTRMLWPLPAFLAPTGRNLCQKECQSIYIYLSVCLSS